MGDQTEVSAEDVEELYGCPSKRSTEDTSQTKITSKFSIDERPYQLYLVSQHHKVF